MSTELRDAIATKARKEIDAFLRGTYTSIGKTAPETIDNRRECVVCRVPLNGILHGNILYCSPGCRNLRLNIKKAERGRARTQCILDAMKKICPVCLIEFSPLKKISQIYCTDICLDRSRRKKLRMLKCPACSDIFKQHKANQRFCTTNCRMNFNSKAHYFRKKMRQATKETA